MRASLSRASHLSTSVTSVGMAVVLSAGMQRWMLLKEEDDDSCLNAAALTDRNSEMQFILSMLHHRNQAAATRNVPTSSGSDKGEQRRPFRRPCHAVKMDSPCNRTWWSCCPQKGTMPYAASQRWRISHVSTGWLQTAWRLRNAWSHPSLLCLCFASPRRGACRKEPSQRSAERHCQASPPRDPSTAGEAAQSGTGFSTRGPLSGHMALRSPCMLSYSSQ